MRVSLDVRHLPTEGEKFEAASLDDDITNDIIHQWLRSVTSWRRCGGTRRVFASMISAGSAIIFSGSLVNPGPVTGCTRHPGAGDPRVNIQNSRGKAKAYQVRQVLLAVDRLESDDG